MNTILQPSPLTSNTLDHYQRARLIRSTRKLGAVLGTTPRLAEVDPTKSLVSPPANSPPTPRTKASRRHGSIFTIFPIIPPGKQSEGSMYSSSSTNSSLCSLALPEPRSSVEVLPTPKSFSSKPRRSAEAPRPLILRVNMVPVPTCDARVPLSPYTPLIAAAEPPTPIHVDLPAKPSSAEIRRKRMAKLTRTLGENIPPEMVFPSAPTPAVKAKPTHRAPETNRKASHTSKRSSHVWTTDNGVSTWTGEWNRKDIREVQQKLRALRAK